MKIFTRLLHCTILCIAFATTASSLFAFEGKVELKMITEKGQKEMPIVYYIKGLRMRTEMTIQGRHSEEKLTTVAIIDADKREALLLMDQQKAYMVSKLPDPQTMEKSKDAGTPEFKPTGRKEVIAGYEAEEYVSASKKHVTEMWVTKELGKFIMANQGKGGVRGGSWQQFAETNNFFALRVVQRRAQEGAPEEMRMEVVKIEKGSQPDSLFVPPADYQKMEMPSMGDIMRGMMQNR